MRFPSTVQPGDVWIVHGVNRPVLCFKCRKFIRPNAPYVVWTRDGLLFSANPHHTTCIDGDLIDAVTELAIAMEIEL
jgi:hypothetical protein